MVVQSMDIGIVVIDVSGKMVIGSQAFTSGKARGIKSAPGQELGPVNLLFNRGGGILMGETESVGGSHLDELLDSNKVLGRGKRGEANVVVKLITLGTEVIGAGNPTRELFLQVSET